MRNFTPHELAKYMDHTLLKADATDEELRKLCREAREYGFFSVCVNPCNVEKAKEYLETDSVKVCTVVGFPLGQNTTECKSFETHDALLNGADEIDMVINIGRLKDKDYEYVKEDIAAVRNSCMGKIMKVIIETALLDEDEKRTACQIAQGAGADFVKTSTGFSVSGAKAEDIVLMRETVGDNMGVKASGGIRTLKDSAEMIEKGATRLGVSASVNIIEELKGGM